MKEKVDCGVKVEAYLEILQPDGSWGEKIPCSSGVVTTNGLNMIAKLYGGGLAGITPSYMGVGSDDGSTLALAASNTALGTQLEDRHSLSKSVSGAVLTCRATFGQGHATGNHREIGLFESLTGSDLQVRIIRDADVTKAAGDAWRWTITVTFS